MQDRPAIHVEPAAPGLELPVDPGRPLGPSSARAALSAERERVALLTFYGIVLLLAYLLYKVFEPFLMPLGWAAVLAIFVYPWHSLLEQRYGRTRAASLSTMIVTLVIVAPGVLVLTAFVREATDAIAALDRDQLAGPIASVQRRWLSIRHMVPGAQNLDIKDVVDQTAARVGGFIATRAGVLLADLALFVFSLFVTLFALFFLLRDATGIVRRMRQVLPFDEPRRERMIRQTQDLVYASVTSGIAIAVLQGLLGGLLFWIFGLHAPVFWGVVMGFFSLLPFFGTWIVWLPAAIWMIVSGDWLRGVVMLAIGGGVVASVDNVIRPAVLSGRARMNGLLMFISLLGGISVFGLLGLVLGPLVVALVAGLLEAYASPAPIVTPRGVPARE